MQKGLNNKLTFAGHIQSLLQIHLLFLKQSFKNVKISLSSVVQKQALGGMQPIVCQTPGLTDHCFLSFLQPVLYITARGILFKHDLDHLSPGLTTLMVSHLILISSKSQSSSSSLRPLCMISNISIVS